MKILTIHNYGNSSEEVVNILEKTPLHVGEMSIPYRLYDQNMIPIRTKISFYETDLLNVLPNKKEMSIYSVSTARVDKRRKFLQLNLLQKIIFIKNLAYLEEKITIRKSQIRYKVLIG